MTGRLTGRGGGGLPACLVEGSPACALLLFFFAARGFVVTLGREGQDCGPNPKPWGPPGGRPHAGPGWASGPCLGFELALKCVAAPRPLACCQ